MYPIIIETKHTKDQRKKIARFEARAQAKRKRRIKEALIFSAHLTILSATLAGTCGLMYAVYPTSSRAQIVAVAHEVPPPQSDMSARFAFDDSFEFYPPEYDTRPVPIPQRKPSWIVEQAEFQAQLEESLK